MGMPLELKEFLHNLKDRAWDVNPVYQIDENEAGKIIKQLDRIDNMFVNVSEIKSDDEIFNDDYADKNIQNGWIYCKDRLPEENGVYLACYEDATVLLDWFNGKWFFHGKNPAVEETGTIIAWQPLPQPYKAERRKRNDIYRKESI